MYKKDHKLKYLNSIVIIITHIYKTVSTRGDTEWISKAIKFYKNKVHYNCFIN